MGKGGGIVYAAWEGGSCVCVCVAVSLCSYLLCPPIYVRLGALFVPVYIFCPGVLYVFGFLRAYLSSALVFSPVCV